MATYTIRRTVRSGCPICETPGAAMDVCVKRTDGSILETTACWACIRSNWSDEEWLEIVAIAAA